MISKLAKEYYLVWAIPIALMILAPFSWPHGYYTFLRIVLTLSAGLICYWHIIDSNKYLILWGVAFGLFAILYNPLIPIYLHKSQWIPINIVTSIIYFSNIIYLIKIGKK